jgi:hypothetical protein
MGAGSATISSVGASSAVVPFALRVTVVLGQEQMPAQPPAPLGRRQPDVEDRYQVTAIVPAIPVSRPLSVTARISSVVRPVPLSVGIRAAAIAGRID